MFRRLLPLLLLLPTLVAAQGSYVGSTPPAIKNTTVGVTPVLQAIPFATITVCAAADPNIPCTTKVSIFKDAAETQPLQNPFPADINGNYTFAVNSGNYTVTITGSGVTGFSYQVTAGASSSSNATFLNSVPFCTGFTPTNNQFLQYTTALSPNPCYTAATAASGGGSPGAPANSPQCNSSGTSFKACGNNGFIQYVSSTGSDSNNGLSWDTAKATIFAALEALPGGTASPPLAGQGTVIFGDNVFLNPDHSKGLWVVAVGDPNYNSPPSGYIKAPPSTNWGIDVIGQGCGSLPASNTTNISCTVQMNDFPGAGGGGTNNPALHLEGGPIHIENMNIVGHYGRCMTLSIDSNGGRSAVFLNSANTSLKNISCGGADGVDTNGIGRGPSIDIGSNVFNVFFDQVTIGINLSVNEALITNTGLSVTSGVLTATFQSANTAFFTGEGCGIVGANNPAYNFSVQGTPGGAGITVVDSTHISMPTSLPNGTSGGGVLICDRGVPVVLDPGTGAGGNIVFSNAVINGGGFKSYGGGINVRDTYSEGDFTHCIGPELWYIASGGGLGQSATMINVGVADQCTLASGGSIAAYKVEGGIPSDNIQIFGSFEFPYTEGSLTFHGDSNYTVKATPLERGEFGVLRGHLEAQTDVARHSPQSVRFLNTVPSSGSWTSGGTITSGQTDNDGGTAAVKVTSASGSQNLVFMNGSSAPGVWNVGDTMICGVWMKSLGTPNAYTGNPALNIACNTGLSTGSVSGGCNSTVSNGDGEWDWYFCIETINVSAAFTNFSTGGIATPSNPIVVYAPTLIHVPAGQVSSNEAIQLAFDMRTLPPSCAVGQMCDNLGPVTHINPGTIAGQILTAQSTGTASFLSPSTVDGNGGLPVTTTPYNIQCDSGTTIIDRVSNLRFQPGSGVVNVPLSTIAGCTGGFRVTVTNDGAGTLTFNRSSPDTFSIFTGGATQDNATTFTLKSGQFATLTQGATGIWEVFITSSIAGGTLIDASLPPYNVLPGNSWLDATWVNGSNTVTIGASDAPFTVAMNGWLCGGTSGPVTGTPSDFNSVLVKVLGTFTFVSATSGTCSGTAANASASGTSNGVLVMGPDDTTALNAAWQAASGGASGTSQSQCGTLILPAGILFTKTGQFNTVNCNNAMTGNLSAGLWVYGWGRTTTRIVPALDQFNFTGVTYNSKNCLFFCHNGINVNQLGIWGAGYENTGAQTAAVAACSTDSQYNQFELNDWGAGNGGANFLGFWVPSGLGCAPVYGVTINTAAGIGCEFDGAINISYSECGPSQIRSMTISAAVRSVQLVAGLPGFPSGSLAVICSQNAPDVVTICNGGVWYSGAGDQIGGNSTNIAIDVTSGGTLFANQLSTNYGSNLGLDIETGGVVESCNSTFAGQGTSATGMAVNGGGIYRSLCGNNTFFGTAGGNGLQVVANTAQVILNPLDGWIQTNQAIPTISGTIFGTGPTANDCSGGEYSTAEAGCKLVTEGTSPPASGTVILTFNQTYKYQNLPVCTLAFLNGTGSWNARVSAITTTQSSTAYTWTVDNNAVALTAASTYGVIWNCTAR